jgi:hypothetical protein
MSIASGSSSSSSLGQSYFRETHSQQIPVVDGACGAGGAGCQLFGFLDSITTEPVKTGHGACVAQDQQVLKFHNASLS